MKEKLRETRDSKSDKKKEVQSETITFVARQKRKRIRRIEERWIRSQQDRKRKRISKIARKTYRRNVRS